VAQLVARGVVYRCWCTRAEVLEAASAPHENLPGGAYVGTCRELTPADHCAARAAGKTSCLRVRAAAVELAFNDEVMGEVSAIVDDFVIVRKDGVPAYNLAVVVDDAAAGVGHVVRGDDLALGTPRQLLLQSWLGLPHPSYAHVPLMLDSDGRRLSKRSGSITVAQRRALGDDDAQIRGLVNRARRARRTCRTHLERRVASPATASNRAGSTGGLPTRYVAKATICAAAENLEIRHDSCADQDRSFHRPGLPVCVQCRAAAAPARVALR